MSEFFSKNEMSAASLIKMQGAPINLIKSPKTGKVFFACGEMKGYASEKAVSILTDASLSDAEALGRLRFAEVAKSDSPDTFVPCLMVVATSNVVASRGASALASL